jgi:poly(A) polymerase
VRSIGDPDVRLREDPVRMIRAIALAARLDFTIEPTLLASIRTHRHEIAKSSLPRLLEEYYKILRAGSSEKAFRGLAEVGLLEPTSPELHRGAKEPLWGSLAALDAYRRRFEATPETLTNAILMGSLLVPLGIALQGGRSEDRPPRGAPPHGSPGAAGRAGHGPHTAPEEDDDTDEAPPRRHMPGPRLGDLPLARRDVERLRQIVGLQRRIRDLSASPRAQRALAHRHIFREALTWLDIHGGVPEVVEHWKAIIAESGESVEPPEAGVEGQPPVFRPKRRRRRRRRRFSPTPGQS